MHRHDNAVHSLDDLAISARPGESFIFPQGSPLDVERAVSEILRDPDLFILEEIALSALAEQIKGQTKLNFHYVATMERHRARRPLLLGRQENGALLLLDGRHRAARSLQLGYKTTKAWTLTPSQIDLFRL